MLADVGGKSASAGVGGLYVSHRAARDRRIATSSAAVRAPSDPAAPIYLSLEATDAHLRLDAWTACCRSRLQEGEAIRIPKINKA